MSKLSIVIPVWNEEKTLEVLVDKVLQIPFSKDIEKEIILVNDGSKDKSGEIMDELAKRYPEIKSYHNEQNSGKTQTVKNGIAKSTGDYVVVQDADLEYEPNELVDLVELMRVKNVDVVYGDRFGRKNKVVYWQNYFGNRMLSVFSNFFTYPRIWTWIPDMEVCYKLMPGKVARDIGVNIQSKSRFGLEPEITARLSRYKLNGKHLKFGIVPISYFPRTIAEGKKMNAINDGMKALKEILQYNIFKI